MSWIKGPMGDPTWRGVPDAPLEPPAPRVCLCCDECGEEIEEGDEYYWIAGNRYCASCVEDGRRYAGVDYDEE